MKRLLAVALLPLVLAGCGVALGGEPYGWLEGRPSRPTVSTRAVQLRWRRRLTTVGESAYIPLERASAALDPVRDRVYIGTSDGRLHALTGAGTRIYAYDARSAIAASPVLDVDADELYIATEGGVLHRLRASSGALGWRSDIGGAVTQTPVLAPDAAYVVTDADAVLAFERATGEALWRVRRDPTDGEHVARHAGIALVDGVIYVAVTEGTVLALDAGDGALLWERDTAVDLDLSPDGPPRFADVDTTPVVVGDVVFVASFAGGLYALERASGSVLYRDERLTGITDIVRVGDDQLILASGEEGVVLYDHREQAVRWQTMAARGAPGRAVVVGDLVLVGETRGSFVTLALRDGQELGRFDAGHGFAARASVASGRGFVLSNGGSLLAFALPGAPR